MDSESYIINQIKELLLKEREYRSCMTGMFNRTKRSGAVSKEKADAIMVMLNGNQEYLDYKSKLDKCHSDLNSLIILAYQRGLIDIRYKNSLMLRLGIARECGLI